MGSNLRHFAALASLVLAAAGCSDSTEPPLLANGSMSAQLDGASWVASTGIAATWTNNILGIAGTDGQQRTIGIGGAVSGPGTFPIGATSPTNASVNLGGPAWMAALTNGSGSITITSISATGAKGTFQFTAVPVAGSGATGNKVVTQGVFDVTF